MNASLLILVAIAQILVGSGFLVSDWQGWSRRRDIQVCLFRSRDPGSPNNFGLNKTIQRKPFGSRILSRREWFDVGAVVVLTTVGTAASVSAATEIAPVAAPKPSAVSKLPRSSARATHQGEKYNPGTQKFTGDKPARNRAQSSGVDTSKQAKRGALAGKELNVNMTKVLSENTINVTVTSADEKMVSVDRKNFTKVELQQLPHTDWILPIFRPSPKIVKEIPNSELLVAGVVAGTVTESIRTAILYPISTVKVRIQVRKKFRIRRGVKSLIASFRRQARQGNLYAGIVPSLLVSVPSSGVYCGVRDVTKRMLNMALKTPTKYDDLAVTIGGALVADVVSVAVRTPADALALRLQVKRNEEDEEEAVGDWWTDSLKKIPAVILTDLPYLLSRIALNKLITSGHENLGRFEIETIIIACGCAALTTPFDVTRTRILVDSDNDPSNGRDGGSGEGVLETMVQATREGDGGVRNLYAGWVERTTYLGIARAWLDPIKVIGYLGIRDAVLLQWFD